MTPEWSLHELDELIGESHVTFTYRDGTVTDPPDGLTPASVTPMWNGDVGDVHPPDRSEAVRAYARAMRRPGTVEDVRLRVNHRGTLVWCRVRYLNLLHQADVGSLVRVIEGVDGLATSVVGPGPYGTRDTAEVPWVRFRCDASRIMGVEGMAEHLFGVPGHQLVGLNTLDIVHHDDLMAAVEAGISAVAARGTDVTISHRVVRPDGKIRQVEATLTVSPAADGTWVIFLRDAERAMHVELLRAVEAGELVLHYQPVVDARSARIVGAEALLRWHHPTRGLVPPLDFIPVAEASGAIVEVGAWVLAEACAEAASWPEALHVAVNLSARQLVDGGIVAIVRDALTSSGLAPHRLVLELTESALMEEPDRVIGHLRELKALGLRLAIDDFGTGYSSLLYLKQMPVDILKVDRSFVSGLGEDPGDTAIVASVISLAHVFGLQAIGEGVETPEQHRHICRLNCDLAQGYLWSRPLPADELRDLLAPSTDRWSKDDLRDLVSGRFVALYGPGATPLPMPDWMRHASLGPAGAGTEVGAGLPHVDDRARTAEAFQEAMFNPAEPFTVTYRTNVQGEWVVTEVTFVNLLDHPLVEAVVACGLPGRPIDAPAAQSPADDHEPRPERWIVGRLDVSGRILEIDGDVVGITGRSAVELIGMSPVELMHPSSRDDSAALWWKLIGTNGNSTTSQRCFLHPDGTEVWAACTYLNRLGETTKGDVLWMAHDITGRHPVAEDVIPRSGAAASTTDVGLTSLVERHDLEARLADALRGDPTGTLVVLLDLHGFQAVADAHGRGTGATVLDELGARLADAVRPSDTLSRYGDDEFVLVCTAAGDVDADVLLDRLRLVLAASFLADGSSWQPSPRLGAARGVPGDDAASLVRRAALAMFETGRVHQTHRTTTTHRGT